MNQSRPPRSEYMLPPDGLPEKRKLTQMAGAKRMKLFAFFVTFALVYIGIAGWIALFWIRKWFNYRAAFVVAYFIIVGLGYAFIGIAARVTPDDLSRIGGWRTGSGKKQFAFFTLGRGILWFVLIFLYFLFLFPGIAEYYGAQDPLTKLGVKDSNACADRYCGINPECPHVQNSTATAFWANPYTVANTTDSDGAVVYDRRIGSCTCFDYQGTQLCDGEERWSPVIWNEGGASDPDTLSTHPGYDPGFDQTTGGDAALLATPTSRYNNFLKFYCHPIVCPNIKEIAFWSPARVELYWAFPLFVPLSLLILELILMTFVLKPEQGQLELTNAKEENELGVDVDARIHGLIEEHERLYPTDYHIELQSLLPKTRHFH